MVGKNNKKLLREKQSNKVYKYAIKRLTFGVASVAISAGLMFAGGTIAGAEEVPTDAATEVIPEVEEPAEEPEEPAQESAEELTEQEDLVEEIVPEIEPQGTPEKVEESVSEPKVFEGIQFTEDQKARLAAAGYKEYEIPKLEAEVQNVADVADVEAFVIKKIEEKEAEESVEPEVANGADLGLKLGEENVPEAVGAAEEKAGLTEDEKKRAGQSANNWKEEITQDNDYWQVEKGWQGRNLGGNSSIGMALSEINYLGTYTDANGNDVIRLQWQGDTRTHAGSWMNNLSLALKFQKNLYEKIDWEKSYAYSSYGKEEKFLFNNVKSSDYQAEFTLAQLAKSYTGALYELPINLVLKDGVKIADLGKKDYLIQHRGLDVQNKLVLTNVPGNQRDVDLNTIEYGQFTRSTIVPLNSRLDNSTIPANSNKESNRQRFGTSEYDSDKKVIRTKHYYRKSDSLDSYLGNVGFTQSFDARLLDLLKEDEKGNVAYLDVNSINDKKEYTTTPKVAIRRDQINVKDGVATIYVVGSDFQSNLEQSGIKVVRATSGNIKSGIYSTLFKTATINYVNTSIEYNVDEDLISKLFPQNKYLQAYAFQSGFVHENKDGFLRSDQEVKEDTVINKGDKLTLEFKDRINNKGNQYVMQIGDTYHLMNDKSAPYGASEFETISERNVGGIGSRNMVFDITMQAGRTLSAGEKIKLWIINDNGQKYESHSWRLFLNTGNAATDKDIVKVEGENTFVKDYSPYYFQHSKSVDGVMVTKYKYVPQVEEIFDTDTEIKGTVRKDGNHVTGYYIAPTGEKFYFDTTLSADKDSAETIILDENGRKVEEGDEKYDAVYKYALGQLKTEDGEGLKLKKDMPIYINTARKGQFPSDPVIERVKARVTFDQNYEGKPEDKVVVAPENKQYLGTAGYEANGLDYNDKNVMPEDPTREGYVFKGWATKADATEADFTKDTPITESLKVYAVWVKEENAKDADKYTPTADPVEKDKGTAVTEKDVTDAVKVPDYPTEGEQPKVTVDDPTQLPDGNTVGKTDVAVTVTYPDGSTDKLTVPVTIKDTIPEKTDAEKNPAVEPEKTEVEDKTALTPEEKAEVEEKVKEKNPEAKEVEVGDDGSVTLTYPDDSTNTLTPDQTVTEKDKKPEDKRTDAEKNPAVTPTEKTGVKDPNNLTDKEKQEVKDKVQKANPKAKDVTVDDKGNATLIYPDGSTNTIPAEDLVFEYEHGEPDITDKPELKIADIIDPIIPDKTEVGRPGLTQSERDEVERKIIDANKDNFPEGTKVVVDESGNATIIYPDGSIDTIPWNKLVYHRDDEGAAESDKPADEGSDKDSKGTEEASSTAKSSSGLLPETGEADATAIFGAAALSVLAGLGLVAKRREDEEEA